MQSTDNRAQSQGTVWIDSPYPVVALGLARVLEIEGDIEAGYGDSPVTQNAPLLIVVHVDEIEDVSESLEKAKELNPEAPIMVFSIRVSLQLARAVLQKGARGFVHAGMQPAQIARAILVASRGEIAIPREMIELLVRGEEDSQDLDALTYRQREILELAADGLTNAQIAKRLFLSESTIKQHLRSAYKLLNVGNRTEASKLIRSNRQSSF